MPAELEFGAIALVAVAFIGLVALTLVIVIASRVIRLGRGGPQAEQLRLRLQQQAHHGHHRPRMHAQQSPLDVQQAQQAAIDAANPSISIPPTT